jgi:hypothetical protein
VLEHVTKCRRARGPGRDQHYAGRGRRVCQGADKRQRAGQSQTAAPAVYLNNKFGSRTVRNKMAPGGGTIAAALGERVKDIVNRLVFALEDGPDATNRALSAGIPRLPRHCFYLGMSPFLFSAGR